MRIGIFTDPYLPNVSGVVTSVLMLKKGLEEQGHKVFIITVGQKKEYKKEKNLLWYNGIRAPFRAMKMYSGLIFVGKPVKDVRKLKLDVMHVHTEFTVKRIAKKVSKKDNVPIVYTYHTMYDSYYHYLGKFISFFFKRPLTFFLRRVIKDMKKISEVIIVPTKKVRQSFVGFKIPVKTKVIPTGLEFSQFYKENQDANEIEKIRNSLGLKDELVLLFVGRVAKEKSLDVIVREFTKLEDKTSKLLIVGDGPYMGELLQHIRDYKVQERVILTGMIPFDEVSPYYHIGDVFVNASVSETQGLTYIEALASELICLVRYDVNLEELITDNENGIFFQNNEDFGDKLSLILTDEELRNKIKANSRDSIQNYSKEVYAKKCVEVYNLAIKYKKAKLAKKSKK